MSNKIQSNEEFVKTVQSKLFDLNLYKGKIDGWAGALTREAFYKLLPTAKTEKEETKLVEHARKDLGIKETSVRVSQAIKRSAIWLNSDGSKTAWCGCIMGEWHYELGLARPQDYFRAINWLNVGKQVALGDAQPGDVVVVSRSGGNHVALFVKREGDRIVLLGGNQSNTVKESSYPISTLKGIRRTT